MLVNVGSASAYVALATIQGGLVALPSPVTLDRLRRLRSPAWALAAPAAIVIGTFGVLALPALGQSAAALFTDPFSAPAFHQAEVGRMSVDYPDLVLAAVLGGVVAGRAIQGRAAVLVAMLVSAWGGLFAVAGMLPATVPLVVVLVLVELHTLRSRTRAKPIGREPGRVDAQRADRTVGGHGLRLEAHSHASRHDRPRSGCPASSSVQGGGGGACPARG
jgi:hypothetical protein